MAIGAASKLYEWDIRKNEGNALKHRIRFEDAITIFAGMVVEQDSRQPHHERRIEALGMMEDIEVVVVYTLRNGRKRIISARRARKHERQIYQAARKGAQGKHETFH